MLASREQRTGRLLALGVALPTILLAIGWGWATVRERALVRAREEAELHAMLASLEQAIDESLEELRAREDERPYYVWGHYYSPPDVLSLTDPVAVSPLATGPSDPRIIGHFQIGADGRVTTPYAEGPLGDRAPRTPREERLSALLTPEGRATLAALLGDDATLAATAPAPPTVVSSRSRGSSEPSSSSTFYDEPRATQRVQALELNTYGSQLAQEINRAQSGDPIVRNDLWERGRAAPQVSRRTAPIVTRERAPEPIAALPSDATRGPPIEVTYTPMRLAFVGEAPVLVRTVSEGDAAFLQGVVLDRVHLADLWVPRLLARFVVTDPPATLVRASDRDARPTCAIERPLGRVVPDLSVCVSPGALSGAPLTMIAWLERGSLVGLVLVVVLALLLVERTARKERALSRQKSQFVSAVSHELRTPLTTIRMHAEMLADDLVEPERRPRVHEELVGETVRLTRLVENVLEASRIEEGRRPIRARVGDLRAQLRAIVGDLERFARGKGFEIVGPEDGEPIEISFDPGAIEQIVVNLVDNAIKYTGDGERRVELACELRDREARVVVRDHGEGIPAAEKARVFERFHRIERAMQAHQPGTGLGLAIVRELALAHGGRVTLHDRAPRGLEVIVSLPA